MDNGVIFFILFGPALFVLGFIVMASINLLIRAIVVHLTAPHSGRSERAYVRKHQRDTLPDGLL